MADQLSATVIGGGIAGLASAVSLRQAGWHVTVLERAAAFGEVGAGLGVTGNGAAALAALGVDEAVRSAGYEVHAAGYQDQHGRWLIRLPTDRAGTIAATTFVGIHRQRLHSALRRAAEAAGAELQTEAEVISVEPGAAEGQAAAVTWHGPAGEQTAGSDLVVAADGVWSSVRRQLFPDARPVYTGSTSWRAIIGDAGHDDRLIQLLGPGTEFGMLRISDTEVYWYGQFRHPEGRSFDDELAAAQEHFAGWSPQVRATVEATTPSQLMRHDVYHLPGGLPTYVRGRVAIIGDAAHAAQTTIGQGAASALEDGICVGRLIAAPVAVGGAMASALTAFDRARRPRCRQLSRQALAIARFGYEVEAEWRQSVRNAIARLLPAGLAVKSGAQIVRWAPPSA